MLFSDTPSSTTYYKIFINQSNHLQVSVCYNGGTVRNVTDFGAFVDIGVKHDGLVHISQLSDSFVKNPSDVVSVGDIVKVKIIGIDAERQKVQLSMREVQKKCQFGKIHKLTFF